MGTWNSESLAKGILEALTWLCITVSPRGEEDRECRPHGLLEKSLGKGHIGALHLSFPRGRSLL
jgi:hypothetical protein